MLSVEKSLENLKEVEVKYNFPLRGLTTFKIGGNANYLFIIHSEEALLHVVRCLSLENKKYYVLGAGSNLLISDRGVKHPIIKLGRGFEYIRQKIPRKVDVGAATLLSKVLQYCIEERLTGLEPLSGIPATIGGLVVMNASSFGKNILSLVERVEVLDTRGYKKSISREEISCGYRTTSLKDYIVMQVTFVLEKSSGVEDKMRAFLKERRNRLEYRFPSSGCIFRNPYPRFAGELIDQCGLKGFSVGGASVSSKHANFIVNKGNAHESEVSKLIGIIKEKVKNKYTLELEEEIIRW